MSKTKIAPIVKSVRRAPHDHGDRDSPGVKRTGKRPKNLTLDPDAVARGEAYGLLHGTNVSQLVNGLLKALPAAYRVGSDEMTLAELSPLTRRLYGIAAGGTTDRNDYRAHLLEKFGSGATKGRQ